MSTLKEKHKNDDQRKKPQITRIRHTYELTLLTEKTIVGVKGREQMLYLGKRDDELIFLGRDGDRSAIEIIIALEEISVVRKGRRGGSLIFGPYKEEKRYGIVPETGEYVIGFSGRDKLLREEGI